MKEYYLKSLNKKIGLKKNKKKEIISKNKIYFLKNGKCTFG